MSVYKRKWKTNAGQIRTAWVVHVEWASPDGSMRTVRKTSPVQTKRGAERYERELRASLSDGTYGKEKQRPVPSLAEFAIEFMEVYVKVNNKHSTCDDKKSMLRLHLVPFFGRMKLDSIGPREIERYKAAKAATHSVKTLTNQLSVLRKLLNVAHEWGLISAVPKFKWMKLPPATFRFLDFDEAERLVDAAEQHSDPTWRTMVLLVLAVA